MNKLKVRKLTFTGAMIAMSYVGAMISIGGGTIALDSMPAFYAAVALGPVYGGVVGLIGHLLTAVIRGFPLGLPIHLVVAIMMFISCYGFGLVYSKSGLSKVLGVVTGTVLNGPVALGVTAAVIGLMAGKEAGLGMFTGMILPLTMAAGFNVLLAAIVYNFSAKAVNRLWNKRTV